MTSTGVGFAEKRRILQLETLYDLSLALHAQQPEGELVEELLQRVCAVLDPAAALAVTRDAYGKPQAVASVGWVESSPGGETVLADPLWHDLLAEGRPLRRTSGTVAGRPFSELMAAPLACRGVFLGLMAVLDKEGRGTEEPSFSDDDRRFLDSVSVLAGVALDSVRQVERLAEQRQRLEEENQALRGQFADEVGGRKIIAHGAPMRRVLELAERVAARGISVVVRGESGTGKEMLTKLIHLRSGREGSLIALNCAALPEGLLESELFGIERGVATGVQARPGKLELAHGGTLFLDEIGDMQPAVQVKLLRALQEREVVRVGGHKAVPVDVRVIAATHRDLEEMVRRGEFREDLYYRLKGIVLEVPPLRERKGDIPHLVRYFTESFCQREGLGVPPFRADALTLLMSHDYPGNVRELQNLVEGALSLAEGEVNAPLVRSLLGGEADDLGPEALDLATVEKRHIRRVLQMTRGNKTAASKILGLDRKTLQRRGF
ncbi:MAG: sigma 54-interacting transcriptional regulator [Acidobacteriota bacterium]